MVLGAAQLDQQLYQILQLYLYPSGGKNDELLDGDSPLGTFSAKIHLIYRLVLADAQPVRELTAMFKPREKFDEIVEQVSSRWPASAGSLEFRVALTIVSVRLERILGNINPVTQDQSVTLIPPKWSDEADNV